MCHTSVSELPPEVLVQILLSLPPADIVKTREISHLFLDLISGSQSLQHRIDLFSAGLVDNPRATCSLAERRTRLNEYVDGWKHPGASSQYDCLLEGQVGSFPIDQDIFAARLSNSMAISPIHSPPSPDQKILKGWKLEFPFRPKTCAVCLRYNLLAVVEEGIEFVKIRFLDLTDGSPHEIPLNKVLSLDLGHYRGPRVIDTQISDSRIALVVEVSSFTMARSRKELIAWDWKTGEVVLDHSSDDPDISPAIPNITTIRFLEGSWLLALSHRIYVSQLLVFNTLLPQQDPRSWRILDLPPLFKPNPDYRIFTQYEKPLADCPEFSVDPAQRIFVLVCHMGRALAVLVEPFIRHMHREHANPWITWDEWGEEVITVHLPPDASSIQLYDTKLLALYGSSGYRRDWDVLTYDLSKSGGNDIQVRQVDEGEGARCRRVLSTSKQLARCEVKDGNSYGAHLIGNQVFCFIGLPLIPTNGHRIRIWKIGQT